MMNPGLHELSMSEHRAVDAVTRSLLIEMSKSPAHARLAQTTPDAETDAMFLGTAIHAAVLEPHDFARSFVVMPAFPGHHSSNKHKAAKAEWLAEHPDKVSLKQAEYDACEHARDAVWAHPEARALLSGKGLNERSIIWRDDETGLLCKARPDRLTTWGPFDVPALVDLKSTRCAEPWAFGRDAGKRRYHRQAAWYVEGADTVAPLDGGYPRAFIIIAVEKEPPWGVVVYQVSAEAIEAGKRQNRRALRLYKRCLDTNEWPCYGGGVVMLDTPPWILEEGEEGDDE
jgi:exodeoxyribonuclease VIII